MHWSPLRTYMLRKLSFWARLQTSPEVNIKDLEKRNKHKSMQDKAGTHHARRKVWLLEKLASERPGAMREKQLRYQNAKITANTSFGWWIWTNIEYWVMEGVAMWKAYNRTTFQNVYVISVFLKKNKKSNGLREKVRQNVPIQIVKMILDLAKTKMVNFAYNVLDFYVRRKEYPLKEMAVCNTWWAGNQSPAFCRSQNASNTLSLRDTSHHHRLQGKPFNGYFVVDINICISHHELYIWG